MHLIQVKFHHLCPDGYTGYKCVLKYDQFRGGYGIYPPAWYIQLKIEKSNYWSTYSDFVILSEM